MASLSGVFNFQATNDSGAPLASGRLYTYTAGTTTKKTAYTDAAGSVAHTYVSDGAGGEYIALNSRGELPSPLFLASGAYDITLKTSAGVTVWTRRAKGLATGDVTVADYGADSTGASDSTAAFNLATAALRAAIVDTDYDYVKFKLVVPPGVYSVSSWDLTELLARRVEVHMDGATLVARTASKHVIDALGSRWVSFHGGVIYSASGVVAKSGIQIGPKGTETCGNNSFHNVSIMGYYSHGSFMNLGSETTTHHNCTYINRNTSATAYANYCDGLSNASYLPTSDYATVTRVAGTALSFTANSYYSSQCRNEGGGSASYLGQTQGWEFDKACYHLSFNDSAAVVYGTGTYRTAQLTLRGSFESNQDNQPTAGNIGLRYAVTFDNDGTNTAIDGFTFESSNLHAETFVFRNAGAGTLRLSDADIRVHNIQQSGAVMFGTSGSISIDGVLMTQSSSKTNLGVLTAFNGTAVVDAYSSLVSVPAAGAYSIYSRSDNTAYSGGTHNFTSFTFTPTVTFATAGDLSVVYTAQSGWGYKIGKIRFVQIALTFTPTHSTASGEFRIAGLPASSASGTSQESAFNVVNMNSGWTWPASTTQVTGRLPSNSTNIRLYGHLTGGASVVFDTTHVPSASAKSILLAGWYLEP